MGVLSSDAKSLSITSTVHPSRGCVCALQEAAPLATLLTLFVCQYLLSSPSLSSAGYRSTHSLIKLLEERKLEFLYPLKVIQKELSSLLQANTNTVGVYKWIKTNVDPSLYSDPEFVAMLTTWLVCECVVHLWLWLCAHASQIKLLCQ